MTEIIRLEKGPRMSRIVVHGNTIYLAGQTASDDSANITGQTQQALRTIEDRLSTVGSDKHHLLSATIWITDMANFEAMNAVWEAWVSAESPPVRATVEAKLASPKLLIEIGVIAAVYQE